MNPEIDGALERGDDDSEVDDEGRISDARLQRIWARIRAHLEQWNQHLAAEVFADIEAVARERNNDAARQILGDIRLARGAVALGDARLAVELGFRVGAGAAAADLMPDAKRYRSWKVANWRSSQRHHGTAEDRNAKIACRKQAFERELALGREGAMARAALSCKCSKRTIQRAIKQPLKK